PEVEVHREDVLDIGPRPLRLGVRGGGTGDAGHPTNPPPTRTMTAPMAIAKMTGAAIRAYLARSPVRSARLRRVRSSTNEIVSLVFATVIPAIWSMTETAVW